MTDNLTPEKLLLSHFTDTPLGVIRSVEQKFDGDYRSCYEKPRGLWVSVDGDDDWKSWCESESFGLGSQRHRISIKPQSSVLLITSAYGLDVFTETFGRHPSDNDLFERMYIDWPEVAKHHGGIIIAPYQWSQRMTLNWYYGWDCASGCIWDADQIAIAADKRVAA